MLISHTFCIVVVVFLFPSCTLVNSANVDQVNKWTLTVVHSNDIHAHIDPVDVSGGTCANDDFSGCFGGVSRHTSLAKKVRAEKPGSTLYLNGGDNFQGTLFSYLFRYSFVGEVVKRMKFDAITLGNHEFDDGSEGLAEYLKALGNTTPVVVCNINVSEDPLLNKFNIRPSVVLNVSGHQIGIIGFMSNETKYLAAPSKQTKFLDEIEAVKAEAKKLKEQGVNIIIGLGHSGYDVDQQLAKEVPEMSLVVGGHSHTFLSDEPIQEHKPTGPYPTIVKKLDGSNALVVQAYWMAKYVGRIDVTFDTNSGRVLEWKGSPLLMNDSYKPDAEMENFIKPYRTKVRETGRKRIASTRVLLNGHRETCAYEECNMGNLLSDAMVNWFSYNVDNGSWSMVSAAVMNAGSIRSSISEIASQGEVTFSNLVSVLPFNNKIWAINVTGNELRYIFEQSVAKWSTDKSKHYGAFLQVSGIRIAYDMDRPPMQRVLNIRVRCRHCRVPILHAIESKQYYQLAIVPYLLQGGDGYNFSFLDDSRIFKTNDAADLNVTETYLQKVSPIWQPLEDRIILGQEMQCSLNSAPSLKMFPAFLLATFVSLLRLSF